MTFSSQALKARALELGFNLVGITPAQPSPFLDHYLRWVEAGMHGLMGYMARPDRQARRRDLSVILPGVRSLVVVGLDYRTSLPENALHEPGRGRIAAYAWGIDYHDVMTPRLQALGQWLAAETGVTLQQRAYVDTGAILERGHAHQAGLGFIGKNTMLIHPRRGSMFFLGELLTDLEFDAYDSPMRATLCGNCTRCLSACPTDAFPQPHMLDARRCISYLTIEHKGWIDRDLRPLMGNWIYGCDVCQEVCPFQRFAPLSGEAEFAAESLERAAPRLLDILALDETRFSQRYYKSPIARIRRERLIRNACIAAGNWRDEAAAPLLGRLLEDPSPLVRGHAGWALAQVLGPRARPLIEAAYRRETDAEAVGEWRALLDA